MQKIATVSKGTASLHGRIPGHLLHPLLVRMIGDAGNSNSAALEMDEEQHVEGHQSSQREDLHREEVGAREHREMNSNELRPGRLALTLRSWGYAVTTHTLPTV